MSNVGAWASAYETLDRPLPMGDVQTYLLAAWWVQHCERVDDWGCGGGGLRPFIGGGYRGLDGSPGPYTDEVVDLATHDPMPVEGIVIRHVLEHDARWEDILERAVAAFTERLCVIVFTPLVGTTHRLATEDSYNDIPVIAFSLDDLRRPFIEIEETTIHDVCTLSSPWSHYGVETLIYAQRR